MNYSFNPALFKALFHTTINAYQDIFKQEAGADTSPGQLIQAMDQAIDVMERADADKKTKPEMFPLKSEEVTEIGEHALSIIDMCLHHIEDTRRQQCPELMRLSIPVAVWVARQGGRINTLDLIVNSMANLANELQDTHQLKDLCGIIGEIIDVTSDEIKQDLESTNPMRPWRVMNLNYCIIATRSHDTRLMERTYDALIKNLPHDARQFFKEGMQQMDVVGYPQEVRDVVARYDREWGADSTLH